MAGKHRTVLLLESPFLVTWNRKFSRYSTRPGWNLPAWDLSVGGLRWIRAPWTQRDHPQNAADFLGFWEDHGVTRIMFNSSNSSEKIKVWGPDDRCWLFFLWSHHFVFGDGKFRSADISKTIDLKDEGSFSFAWLGYWITWKELQSAAERAKLCFNEEWVCWKIGIPPDPLINHHFHHQGSFCGVCRVYPIFRCTGMFLEAWMSIGTLRSPSWRQHLWTEQAKLASKLEVTCRRQARCYYCILSYVVSCNMLWCYFMRCDGMLLCYACILSQSALITI